MSSYCSLKTQALTEYVCKQLNVQFPDGQEVKPHELLSSIDEALGRSLVNFGKINRTCFQKNGEAYFNHLHSNAYSMFLYLLSNVVYVKENGVTHVVEKVFYLNKLLNGVDVLWDTPLKEYFYFSRPLGTTLGNMATYGNYFVVLQGCTVGASSTRYPEFGDAVVMYTNSTVMGGVIGNNVQISAHASTFEADIPDNTTVFGLSTGNTFKPTRPNMIERFFNL
ncbi:MAG: hypothetical protein OCC49_12240 [Fibrobacterales bacterium]